MRHAETTDMLTLVQGPSNGQQAAPARVIEQGGLSWVLAGDVRVPPYQRVPKPYRVKKIAEGFDPDKLDALKISQRADGSLWVIDGNHRLQAILALGWSDQLVPVRLLRGLSYQQEAALFAAQRDRSDPSAAESFRAALDAGDADAITVRTVCESLRLSVAFTSSRGSGMPRTVHAVAAAWTISRGEGEARLRRILGTVDRAWGAQSGVFAAQIIRGFNAFFARYERLYDAGRLDMVLARMPFDHFLAQSLSFRTMYGSDSHTAMARAMLALYNKRLSAGKLPEWDAVTMRGKARKDTDRTGTPLDIA